MKGASKVIMGATLAMVVTLAIVLCLILVLLAELYCTLLLRRHRQLHHNSSSTTTTPATAAAAPELETGSTHPLQAQGHSNTPPGVLQAPRNLFYPMEKHSQQLNHFLKIQTHQPNPSPQPVIDPTTTTTTTTPPQIQEPSPCVVYISNPIFDNMAAETPFETPDSSPSRLTGGGGGSSSGEEEIGKCEVCLSPPLTPMKKLPAGASSVSLRDGRSLGTSLSDSVTLSNNGLSSSSSGSPATSPSW